MLDASIFIGWDPREAAAFAVARSSCKAHLTRQIPIYGLVLDDLIRQGLYTRPIEYRPSAADRPIMWDVVSGAPQSTEHANARFFVPRLAKTGWAMFCDGDVLFRGNVARLFEQLDPSKGSILRSPTSTSPSLASKWTDRFKRSTRGRINPRS